MRIRHNLSPTELEGALEKALVGAKQSQARPLRDHFTSMIAQRAMAHLESNLGKMIDGMGKVIHSQ